MADDRKLEPPPAPMSKTPEDCTHTGFHATVEVNRLEDSGLFAADVRIHCVECGEPFRFKGVPAGWSPLQPTCSIDGLELHLPIEPEGEKRLHQRASFTMPTPPARH